MEEVKFPYVANYGKISEIFEKIVNASEPSKLTHEMLQKILGRQSNSDRPFISFLKRLKFLNEENVPTQYYKDYRDKTKSKVVMAKCLRDVYADVYATHEELHTLDKNDLLEKFKIITGFGNDSKVLGNIVHSFLQLVELSDFNTEISEEQETESEEQETPPSIEEYPESEITKKFGFSYTINLNLPATTDQRVYNAIFKSLRENLLK